jgi:urease accessory protein
VTTLPNDTGVVVRLLGERVETVRSGLLTAWDAARRDLTGARAPERRRY